MFLRAWLLWASSCLLFVAVSADMAQAQVAPTTSADAPLLHGTVDYPVSAPDRFFVCYGGNQRDWVFDRAVPVVSNQFVFAEGVKANRARQVGLMAYLDINTNQTWDSFEPFKRTRVPALRRENKSVSLKFLDRDLDRDRDGMPSHWEYAHGLSATNANDAYEDLDGDYLCNVQEYLLSTSISEPDSDGFAAAAATAAIDDRVAAGGPIRVWRVIDNARTNYVVQTNCWACEADFSGVVVRSKWGKRNWWSPHWHGTLISPQHIMLPKHCMDGVPNQVSKLPEPVGTLKRFVGRSGKVYERKVVAHLNPYPEKPGWSGTQDIMIGRLDAPLPVDDVAVYPVLPADHTDYLTKDLTGIPCLVYLQKQNAHLADLRGYRGIREPVKPSRRKWFRKLYAGDSGRPCFLWLDDGLCLLFTFTHAYSGATAPVDHREAINGILKKDGYSLKAYDLSQYRTVSGSGEKQ